MLTVGCWLLAAGCWLLAAGCWLLSAVLLDSDPGFLNGSSASLTRIVNFLGSLLLLFFSSFIILEFFAAFKLRLLHHFRGCVRVRPLHALYSVCFSSSVELVLVSCCQCKSGAPCFAKAESTKICSCQAVLIVRIACEGGRGTNHVRVDQGWSDPLLTLQTL